MSWVVTVLGEPAPQGSKSFMGLTPSGAPKMREASKRTKPWRQCIVDGVVGTIHELQGPVIVRMVLTLKRPATAPKSYVCPSKKPDLSKLARAVEDAITDVGGWHDDGQIVEYVRLAKVFPGRDVESLPLPGLILAAGSPDDRSDLFHLTREAATLAWSIQQSTG